MEESSIGQYDDDPTQWERAVAQHNQLLDAQPDRIESIQALYRIYIQSQQYDKAFCVAANLCFLRRTISTEEQGFYEQYRPRGLVVARRAIDDELWRSRIADKNENSYISAILRLISRYVAMIYAQEEKDKGLSKKDRVDLNSQITFVRRFQQINQIMKVSTPLLYIQPTRFGFDYECVVIDRQFTPAVIAGGDLLASKGDKEIVFLIAKNLTYMRPEYFLIRALKMNQATIKVILRSAMVMVAPQLAVPPAEQAAVMHFVQKFQAIIPQPIIAQVKTVVERAIAEGNDFSTTTWMQSVEQTANRAGLLLCNDLEVAARTLQSDPVPLSTLTVKDKLRDLVRYSISEDYFEARRALGLSIVDEPAPPTRFIEPAETSSSPYRDADVSTVKQSLEALSLTEELAPSLLALPLCQIAWANGEIKERERGLAAEYINKTFLLGSPNSTQAHQWLNACPDASYCEQARQLLRSLVKADYDPSLNRAQLQEILQRARAIASASGGFLGFGSTSAQEKAILEKLEAALNLA